MISNEELVQIFGHFDTDHNGRINREEFRGLLGAQHHVVGKLVEDTRKS